MSTTASKPIKKINQNNKEQKKLRSNKNSSPNLTKKHNYLYKWENVHDNKVNTFYNSKINQKKRKILSLLIFIKQTKK